MAETVAAAGDMDVRLRQIIIQGDALLAGQRMALAHDAHVAILEQAYMAYLRVSVQRGIDGEVQAAGCQCLAGAAAPTPPRPRQPAPPPWPPTPRCTPSRPGVIYGASGHARCSSAAPALRRHTRS